MAEIKIVPNVPQTLSLQSVEGELDESTGRVIFTCSDGRALAVSQLVARKIGALGLQPGESFGIRKDWSGEPGEPVSWGAVERPGAAGSGVHGVDFCITSGASEALGACPVTAAEVLNLVALLWEAGLTDKEIAAWFRVVHPGVLQAGGRR